MNDLAEQADALERSGETAKALELWRAAVAEDAQPESIARLGRLCLREGRSKEGEQLLREVIAAHPSHADAYFYLGVYYKEHGDIDEARELLESSVRLNEWAPALVALGHVYRRLKMKGPAYDCFERATKVDPAESEAWFGLGVVQSFDHDSDAIQSFRKAVELDPSNAAAFRELGHIQWRTKDLKAARCSIERALQLDSDDPWAHDYLGNVLLLDDQDEPAQAHFREAIRLWPEVAIFHADLGDALLRLGRSGEAETAYKRAIALDTSNAIANRRLGLFYMHKQHYGKARTYLKRALQSDPSDRQAREALESLEDTNQSMT